jgi:hypothetical protein
MYRKEVVAAGLFAAIILTAGMLLAAVDYTGTWSTEWGPLTMTQTDNKVSGDYGGSYPGTLKGVVKGNTLIYAWYNKNGDKGRGVFRISADGNSFTGTWGRRNSTTDGGPWNGKRVN